ncbi:MAG TPA: amidohydrolase family protein [Pyrinomonadaceae bacterium]|nr:amidohydrolase family protein [Pyrinomonadaceae bacterium]
MTTTLYCARHVLPVSSDVIEDGAVAVRGERIVGVGAREEVASKFPEARVRELGGAALVPGLVNAHTHLELTVMRGFLEDVEENFFAWLRKLTVARNEHMTEQDREDSSAWGAVEAARAGVTCVGDASDNAAAPLRALARAGLRGVVYQEVFGPDARAAREQFWKLHARVEALRPAETERVRVGVSPHAPYTVSAPLIRLVTDFAIDQNLPVMMHAAESRAEEIFLREGFGPFADGLRARGIEWDAPGETTVRYLAGLGFLRARPLLAHCIRVDEDEIAILKEAGAAVAHCPRSNAKLGHGRAPFAAMLRAGLDVGLGSDSVASNNVCDVLGEARYAALVARTGWADDEGPPVSADQVLHAATLGGARALGLGDVTGSLEEGKQADLVAVSLEGAHQTPVHDPSSALVFSSSGRDVRLTVVAGREVFDGERVTTVDERELRARVEEVARRISRVKVY